MYKTQFKWRNAAESWTSVGTYSTEGQAITVALQKKSAGAFLVRVIDKNDNVVYAN